MQTLSRRALSALAFPLSRTPPARVCAVVLPLALAACVSSGQAERYAAMRQDLSRATPPRVAPIAQDPFEGAALLSREALIASVLARNPGLDAARAAWQAELAQGPQALALEDPMLEYSARPRSFGSNGIEAGNDFALSQSLPFPGKRALRGERALAGADAARSTVESERVKLAALASSLFDQYWLAERALETNARHASLLEEAHGAALSRYAAGTGSQRDVLAAETEQGMLSHRERELAAERRVVRERLNLLLHRSPELDLPSPPRELEPGPTLEFDEQALVKRALDTHPELHALAARIHTRELEVALARREFFPDFTLRAGYETTWQEDPLKPVIGIELNLPVQLARRRAALEEAQARLSREQSRTRQSEDRIRFEVVSAVERLREALHLLEISRLRRLPPARDRVASVRAAFATGQADFLEFVDAERALLAAEQEGLEVRASLWVRRAALAQALGESFGNQEVRP